MGNNPANGGKIVRGNAMRVLCQCTMDLISKRQRPYLFRVKVWGQPPHAETRIYDISGVDENSVANLAMRQFEKEMSRPLAILSSIT
jgi:hypothetical protein